MHGAEHYTGALGQTLIYVKDYADAKFGCVPVAQPKTCHCRPRELPGRGTKGPGIPRDLPGKGTVVASYGLRNRDTQDFLACVMSDADANLVPVGTNILLKMSKCYPPTLYNYQQWWFLAV